MAFLQYLAFDGESVPLPVSYVVERSDVEMDSGGVTEAGTRQRDLAREGVLELQVRFQVSRRWLGKFAAYKRRECITVSFRDGRSDVLQSAEMFVDGYQERLVKDTSYGGLWEVGFRLKEY